MNPTGNDWVNELCNSDASEVVLLRTLEKTLDDGTITAFNSQIKQLATTTAHCNLLESTPLELVPALLSAHSIIEEYPTDAHETLELIARYGNAKEVLLVVQESLDMLIRSVRDYNGDNSEDQVSPPDPAQVVWKWTNLIDMYTLAFPRLILRKRSAPATASPTIEHLRKSLDTFGMLFDSNSFRGQDVVESCIRLGYALLGWFNDTRANPEEVANCKILLQGLLYVAVAECLSDSNVKQQRNEFMERISTANSDFSSLNSSEVLFHGKAYSIGQFVAFTLSENHPKDFSEAQEYLKLHLQCAFICLSEPKWRQTAIGWMISTMPKEITEGEYLDGEIASDMILPVASVAATDPNPHTRAIAFQLMTQIVLRVDPEVAFELVHQLADKDCPFPNMRASAVNLLRRLVVRAFMKNPSAKDDPFGAPILLREYAEILFRSPILDELTLDDLTQVDPQEINRIVELLGLYYVLLIRDKENVTGVRDAEFVHKTNDEFINPLRALLEQSRDNDNQQAILAMDSIKVSLERVEETLAGLQL